ESAEVPLDPAVLDACFQSIQPLLPDGPQTFVPLAVARLSLHGPLTGTVQARARLGTAEPGGHLTADIQVGDGGRLLLSIEGLRPRGLPPERVRRSLSRAREIEVQTLEWELADMPSGTAQTRHWVVLSDGSAAAMRLQHELEAAGHTVELAAEPGDTA